MIIIPPPDIRIIIEKLASYVIKNGSSFEDKILEKERNNPKFCFLYANDPYNPYYQQKLKDFQENFPIDSEADIETQIHKNEHNKPVTLLESSGDLFRDLEFSLVSLLINSNISNFKYNIMVLLAKYEAINAEKFIDFILAKYERNPAFDFIKPNNSHHELFLKCIKNFNIIISDHTEKLNGVLELRKKNILKNIYIRKAFEQRNRFERNLIEEEKKYRRTLYDLIDWNDFRVSETIEINEDIDGKCYRPPYSLTSVIREMNYIHTSEKPITENTQSESLDNQNVDIKVLNQYTLKKQELCPICGLMIDRDSITEHIRLESLDPKWKEQRHKHLAKYEKSNFVESGDTIAKNLAFLNQSKKRQNLDIDESDSKLSKKSS